MDDRGRRGNHVSARGDPVDWAATPLGPPDQWSAHLHAAVGMCLDLALPAALYRGPELTVVCNDGFRQLLGIREPALEFWTRHAAAFSGDSFERSLSHVLATGLPIRATMQPHGMTDGNGGPRFLEISLSPVREADGHVAGVLQIVQDVTAHVPASAAGADVARAEQAIADSHTLLWAVIEGTSDAVWVKDREGRYLLFNSAAAAIVGRSVDEVLGQDDRALLPPDVARQVMARDRKILSVGHTVTYEETIPLPAGRRVFSTMKTAWRDAQGRILGTLGVSRDITDAKEAEAALKRQSRLVEAMFNQAVSPFTLMDCDARFIRVNEAFAKYYGKSVDEFAGRLYWDVLPFDRTPENEALLVAGHPIT